MGHEDKIWRDIYELEDKFIQRGKRIAELEAQRSAIAATDESDRYRAQKRITELEAKLAEFQKLVGETKEGELAFTPEDLQAILEKDDER